MKLFMEIDLDNAAFEDDFEGELKRILGRVSAKVMNQRARADGCICDAPEVDDKILDVNGNTVGRLRLVKEEE